MAIMNEYNKDTIKESILNKLLRYYGCTIEEATPKQVYNAVASTVRDQIMLKWRFEKEARRQTKAKRLYYLSIEFLTGRWLHNNLLNLCAMKEYEETISKVEDTRDEIQEYKEKIQDAADTVVDAIQQGVEDMIKAMDNRREFNKLARD